MITVPIATTAYLVACSTLGTIAGFLLIVLAMKVGDLISGKDRDNE